MTGNDKQWQVIVNKEQQSTGKNSKGSAKNNKEQQ
jgi:hypothetical protein